RSRKGGVGTVRVCPTIHTRIVSPSCGYIAKVSGSAPNDHFTVRPYCGMRLPYFGCIGAASGCPAIRRRVISAASVHLMAVCIFAAPNDHFTVGPHGRVK